MASLRSPWLTAPSDGADVALDSTAFYPPDDAGVAFKRLRTGPLRYIPLED